MIEGGGGERSNEGVNKTNLGEGSGGRSGEVWGVTRCVWGLQSVPGAWQCGAGRLLPNGRQSDLSGGPHQTPPHTPQCPLPLWKASLTALIAQSGPWQSPGNFSFTV